MVVDTTLSTGTAETARSKDLARHLPAIGRILMGLMFLVFGSFGLLTAFGLVPEPKTPMSAEALAFSEALTKTAYMIPLSSGTQLIVGLMLLTNRFVPLALVLIAPVLVNIFLFHAFLEPSGVGTAVVLGALEIALAWAYRGAFRTLLTARTAPAGHGPSEER